MSGGQLVSRRSEAGMHAYKHRVKRMCGTVVVVAVVGVVGAEESAEEVPGHGTRCGPAVHMHECA